MMIDESQLYGEDHHERVLDYVEQFFQAAKFPNVRAVYVTGSVVTGNFVLGYSDVDLVILTDDTDISDLLAELRQLNSKLWLLSVHLLKPADFPPPDLFFTVRLLAESRLIYGQDVLSTLAQPSAQKLAPQILLFLSQRLVNLRAFYCSKTVEKIAPNRIIFDTKKLCLFALRALIMIHGERNTTPHHVGQYISSKNDLLSPKNREFYLSLLEQIEAQLYPDSLKARLTMISRTIDLLNEVQNKIFQEFPTHSSVDHPEDGPSSRPASC
jgi:predicted nucleotidyltransferase